MDLVLSLRRYQHWAPTGFSKANADCGSLDGPGGCLFNIESDPTGKAATLRLGRPPSPSQPELRAWRLFAEHHDLASTLPEKVGEMKARLRELRKTLFNPDRCAPFSPETQCAHAEMAAAAEFSGLFVTPYLP